MSREKCNIWKSKLQKGFDTEDVSTIMQEILKEYNSLNISEQEEIRTTLSRLIIRYTYSERDKDKIITGIDIAYRVYYKLTAITKGKEPFLSYYYYEDISQQSLILYGILCTDYHRQLFQAKLQNLCVDLFNKSFKSNLKNLLFILRCLRLYLENYGATCGPLNNDIHLSLDQLYYCIQTPINGIREEVLSIFEHYTKNIKNAITSFENLIDYWPWTNKYKFYFLAILLNNHKLDDLVDKSRIQFNLKDFFQGLRLSLLHKNLFSASQTLMRAILSQEEKEYHILLIEIIRNGTEKELENLNNQWFKCITNKDVIYEKLGLDLQWQMYLLMNKFDESMHKITIIANMFSNQLSNWSFIETFIHYLIDNCFTFELSAQLEIFKLIVDYLEHPKLNVRNNLEFILRFTSRHMQVACSDFRHTIVGKYPIIVNTLGRIYKNESLREEVKKFFINIQRICFYGMRSSIEYQSLSFSLKLIIILQQCLFFEDKKRMSKKCNKVHSKNLGNYLVQEELWRSKELQEICMNLLRANVEYDDVQEHIISVIGFCDSAEGCLEECLKLNTIANTNSNINSCALSSCFIKIAINICTKSNRIHLPNKLFNDFIIKFFPNDYDPLHAYKNGKNLFGYINSLNVICGDEFCRSNLKDCDKQFWDAISIVESIKNEVLEFLNANNKNSRFSVAASFQEMDENLELLVCSSKYISNDHAADRKYLLTSFWLTLKSCCDVATTIGVYVSHKPDINYKNLDTLSICLWIHIDVLRKCRHKGAIEAAGVSLGKLIKHITANHCHNSAPYKLIFSSLYVLFGTVNRISTTRRGAGLTIMLNHLVKNDVHKGRPLFKHVIEILLKGKVKVIHGDSDSTDEEYYRQLEANYNKDQHENMDALVLHYLCVLVKDTDLKEDMLEYYDDILMEAFIKFHFDEWTVRNAALQLFGAIISKILGQKQAIDNEDVITWEPTNISYTEIILRLPESCDLFLDTFECEEIHDTSPLILILGLFSDVNYWEKDQNSSLRDFDTVLRFRAIFWKFLNYSYEDVRKLAAKCLASSHEFRYEIPKFLYFVIEYFFNMDDQNFLVGLIYCMIFSINKYKKESNYVSDIKYEEFLANFRCNFYHFYKFHEMNFYVRSKLINLLQLGQFDFTNDKILELLCAKKNATMNDMIENNLNNCSKRTVETTFREKIKCIYNLE